MLYNPTVKHTIVSALTFLHRRWLNKSMASKLTEE